MTDLNQGETKDLVRLLRLIEDIQKNGYDPRASHQNLENKFRGRDLETARRKLHAIVLAKGRRGKDES